MNRLSGQPALHIQDVPGITGIFGAPGKFHIEGGTGIHRKIFGIVEHRDIHSSGIL
jgi:hypothetical protein